MSLSGTLRLARRVATGFALGAAVGWTSGVLRRPDTPPLVPVPRVDPPAARPPAPLLSDRPAPAVARGDTPPPAAAEPPTPPRPAAPAEANLPLAVDAGVANPPVEEAEPVGEHAPAVLEPAAATNTDAVAHPATPTAVDDPDEQIPPSPQQPAAPERRTTTSARAVTGGAESGDRPGRRPVRRSRARAAGSPAPVTAGPARTEEGSAATEEAAASLRDSRRRVRSRLAPPTATPAGEAPSPDADPDPSRTDPGDR
jgi:hypothetical protein